jgi:hypothetical protein
VTKQLKAIQETLSQQTAQKSGDEQKFPPWLSSNAQTSTGTFISTTDVVDSGDIWYRYSQPESLPQCPIILGQIPLESYQIISLFDQSVLPLFIDYGDQANNL